MPDTNIPNDPWNRVHEALANPRFDFRTITGISRETGLEPDEVQKLLTLHEQEVRVSYSTNRKGHALYTLRDRPQKLQEIISNVKTIVSSSSAI